MDELLKIQEEALAKISACADAKELNDLRVFYLGKKGPIHAAMKSMKTMAPEERKTFGQVSNKTKQEVGQAIEEKKAYLEEKALEGWLLDEIIFGFFIFKKAEPRKYKFAVDIFTDVKVGIFEDSRTIEYRRT